jgi:hypothetical protein
MARSLVAGAAILKRVFIFLLFFYVVLGILGLQFFRGSMNRRCVIETIGQNGRTMVEVAFPLRSCGAYYDANGIARPALNLNSVVKGYICPRGQLCKIIDTTEERPTGFLTYDQIFGSMFTIFQSATEQGWTQTMYTTMDAEFAVAAIYHVLIMVVIELILMSMLTAVIAETFADIRAEYQESIQNEQR